MQYYFYLVKEDTNPLELINATDYDVEGELYIGGLGVGLGYLNSPELTKERFLPNPFGDDGYVYRTGDLVMKSYDENYIFIRRIDDQVKINGYRIELGEIEMVLSSYPFIDQVIVLVIESNLIAYVKPKPEIAFGLGEIENMKIYAQKSLTSYMMPK